MDKCALGGRRVATSPRQGHKAWRTAYVPHSGQCPALHPTIQLPTNLTKWGKTGHVPSANACWIDLFTSSFPIHLLVHDHITSLFQKTSYPMHLSRWNFSSQRHQPCYSRSMASPPPVTVGLWQQPFAFLSVWRKAACQLSIPKLGSPH